LKWSWTLSKGNRWECKEELNKEIWSGIDKKLDKFIIGLNPPLSNTVESLLFVFDKIRKTNKKRNLANV